jgi:hypothetical protein
MKSLVQRIEFYLRYEMDYDVKMRIELACLAVVGSQFHTLHRASREATEREEAHLREMLYLIEETYRPKRGMPEYEEPKLSFRYYSQRSQKTVETTERKRMDIFKKKKVEENR